jgi:transcriptional regulator with XRE-family HTH domain
MSITSSSGNLQSSVATEIRVELARQGRRPSDLARGLGVADKWVSNRLRGITPITIDDLERIAAVLAVKPADLLPVDAQPSIRVTGRYREQAVCIDPVDPNVRILPGDGSSGRADQHRRPRRPQRYVSPMPPTQSVAA